MSLSALVRLSIVMALSAKKMLKVLLVRIKGGACKSMPRLYGFCYSLYSFYSSYSIFYLVFLIEDLHHLAASVRDR